MIKTLSRDEVDRELKSLPGWAMQSDGAIARQYRFEDYSAVINFVTRVADVAERLQHHPDMHVRYSSVEVKFITHDAGGVTTKDIDSAREVDLVLSRPS
jgi:4a-hydroxytetrahydrobiopterin dehydratase